MLENVYGFSNKELKELILENLSNLGIDTDLIEVKIQKGARVILKGAVDSKREHDLILQTIIDVLGVEDIDDELSILEGFDDELEDDDCEDPLIDDDNECIGTEDVFQAMEDGLPYIPPTVSPFDESFDGSKGKRKKRRIDED